MVFDLQGGIFACTVIAMENTFWLLGRVFVTEAIVDVTKAVAPYEDVSLDDKLYVSDMIIRLLMRVM